MAGIIKRHFKSGTISFLVVPEDEDIFKVLAKVDADKNIESASVLHMGLSESEARQEARELNNRA